MIDIFESMLSGYDIQTPDDRRNAMYEVMQQVVLSGLYRGGFFKEAAFYGGTCLRIFHRLKRFSEAMKPTGNFVKCLTVSRCFVLSIMKC